MSCSLTWWAARGRRKLLFWGDSQNSRSKQGRDRCVGSGAKGSCSSWCISLQTPPPHTPLVITPLQPDLSFPRSLSGVCSQPTCPQRTEPGCSILVASLWHQLEALAYSHPHLHPVSTCNHRAIGSQGPKVSLDLSPLTFLNIFYSSFHVHLKKTQRKFRGLATLFICLFSITALTWWAPPLPRSLPSPHSRPGILLVRGTQVWPWPGPAMQHGTTHLTDPASPWALSPVIPTRSILRPTH